MDKIGRKEIISAIVSALEPLDYVYALWEGGAVGFNRVDEWSDIDIHIDVDELESVMNRNFKDPIGLYCIFSNFILDVLATLVAIDEMMLQTKMFGRLTTNHTLLDLNCKLLFAKVIRFFFPISF